MQEREWEREEPITAREDEPEENDAEKKNEQDKEGQGVEVEGNFEGEFFVAARVII